MVVKKEIEEHPDFVKWFSELNKKSGKVAGGKGANLAEIFNLKIPVPPGFVITAQAYDYFIEKAGLNEQIRKLISSLDYENTKQLESIAKRIREIIIDSNLPRELEEEIIEAYETLDTSSLGIESDMISGDLKTASEPVFVAIRSSATTEDLAEASFAGQQESFLNIKGNKNLLQNIKKCFASLFTARAIYYRNQKGFKEASLAVVVQRMINSDKSGVIFSKNPSYDDDENIIIESVFGLGEGIVLGTITPDKYIISPELQILKKDLSEKKIAITRDSEGKTITVNLKPEKSSSQVLKDYEIKRLAEFAIKIEEHYGIPQDIEFAIENDEIFIVQTRPITTLKGRLKKGEEKEIKGKEILKGLAASPGIASGTVKIVRSLEDLQKIKKGDILVTKMTNPDMVVTMQKSSAIVTDEGGLTAHAAIVSREMGIPCFSGNTKILTNKGFLKMEEVHRKVQLKENLLTLSFNLKSFKTEWKKIKNSSKREGKTISISISKNGKVEDNILRTTPEHNFLILDNRIPLYKKIEEILNQNKIIYSALSIPKTVKSKIKFEEDKAYLLGAIFSDGYLRIQKDGSASTVFIQKNIPEKKKFINKVSSIFKKVYNYDLKEVNKNYFYCYKKEITQNIIDIYDNLLHVLSNYDEKSLLNYLAGIIDGDGNFIARGNAIKISLNRNKLRTLESLIVACMHLGIVYHIKLEKNQYRFYICSKLNLLKPYLNRLKIKEINKVTGDVYLSSRGMFSEIPIPGRKGIKSFVKNNSLLSKEEIIKKILPYLKDKKVIAQLKKLITSDLSALRIKNLTKNQEEGVFNIEVKDNNNYIVFSEYYSPIIVKNCVVGTQKATEILKEGEIVTVDGFNGKIYLGKTSETVQKQIKPIEAKTKTKIKVMVDLPTFAERAAKTGIKQVGLTRLEGIIAESGKHPNYFLKQNKMKDYEEIIYKGLSEIAKYFEEIWVRTSDIRSDEFGHLEGAPKELEANPMLGMHGIRFGLKYPEILKAELNAMKRVSEQGKKIGILLPQVISVEEVRQTKEIIRGMGFGKAKLGVMIETPAAVQIIGELCQEKISFISFGTNDLTQYILAVDRGNERVQNLYNEMHPAVLYQLAYVIRVCKREGVESSICGQAGSEKEMVKFLVENGIDSISVNADSASEIAEYVEQIEKQIVQGTDKEPRKYQPEKRT